MCCIKKQLNNHIQKLQRLVGQTSHSSNPQQFFETEKSVRPAGDHKNGSVKQQITSTKQTYPEPTCYWYRGRGFTSSIHQWKQLLSACTLSKASMIGQQWCQNLKYYIHIKLNLSVCVLYSLCTATVLSGSTQNLACGILMPYWWSWGRLASATQARVAHAAWACRLTLCAPFIRHCKWLVSSIGKFRNIRLSAVGVRCYWSRTIGMRIKRHSSKVWLSTIGARVQQ